MFFLIDDLIINLNIIRACRFSLYYKRLKQYFAGIHFHT